jgi:Transglycosylase SLT domain/SPOR domain
VSDRTTSFLAGLLGLLPGLFLASLANAQEPAVQPEQPGTASDQKAPPPSGTAPSDSVCLLIESAASANGLPLEFFARVIWQESRFQPDAVGPVTRSGERARGIAQFMPRTATERGLLDPFDPIAALPKSAEFLKALRDRFGNLGLAAAAYNAGPKRVQDWLTGTGGLPGETRHYVQAITGRPVEEWKDAKGGTSGMAKTTSCRELVALLKQAPNIFVERLEDRVRVGAAQPWGVQLSAGFSRDHVIRTYAAIEAKHRDALAGADALILRSTFRSRGTRDFYQVRVGADSRATADKICARLSATGVACLVLRNSRGTQEAI